MISSKVMKNGMINLPSELRRKLKISSGDTIIFHETEDGFLLVPKKDIFELINPDEYDLAIEIVKEIRHERRMEALKEDK